MMDTTTSARWDVARHLIESQEREVMRAEADRAASMRKLTRELAMRQPIDAGRIAILADRHLRGYRPDDVIAFARALEADHGIRELAQ